MALREGAGRCAKAVRGRGRAERRGLRCTTSASGEGESESEQAQAQAQGGANDAVEEAGSLQDVEAVPLRGQVRVPGKPGVYAVYDPEGTLQFVGISRKLSSTISSHVSDLPELCGSLKFVALSDADRASLQSAWRSWIEQHVQQTNSVPPGNQPGDTTWTAPKSSASSSSSSNARSDIKLTPGKGADDLTVSIKELVDKVIQDNRIVAFTKGNKQQPQCGFSHQVMSALSDTGAEFEVVDVLDETHNPGLREAIKEYRCAFITNASGSHIWLCLPCSFNLLCMHSQRLAYNPSSVRQGRVHWRVRYFNDALKLQTLIGSFTLNSLDLPLLQR